MDPRKYAHGLGVLLEGHRSGNVLWIDQLLVPAAQRGQGLGTDVVQYLERWARRHGITKLRLYAADEGLGRSNVFWELMGFDYDCPDCEEYEEAAWYMSKDL